MPQSQPIASPTASQQRSFINTSPTISQQHFNIQPSSLLQQQLSIIQQVSPSTNKALQQSITSPIATGQIKEITGQQTPLTSYEPVTHTASPIAEHLHLQLQHIPLQSLLVPTH